MTYRDDRDALRERIADLEHEIREMRNRDEEQPSQDTEQTAQDDQQPKEPPGTPAAPSPSRSNWMEVAVPAISILAALILAVFFHRDRTGPVPPAASAATPLPTLPAVEIPEPVLVPEPAPAAEPAERRRASAPSPQPREAQPRWVGAVQRASGISLAPGASCLVEATVFTPDTNTTVPDLVVTCGGQVLYRRKDDFNGMAKLDNDAREVLGRADDRSTFTLQYNDLGERTGQRAEVDLDSNRGAGAVYRRSAPVWRVEFSLAAESLPTTPLSGPAQRLLRRGQVKEVSGAARVAPGARCRVRAMPAGNGNACVAEVVCGPTTLFRAGTEVRCTYDGARPAGVVSVGASPRLRVGADGAEVETSGAGAFRVLVDLE